MGTSMTRLNVAQHTSRTTGDTPILDALTWELLTAYGKGGPCICFNDLDSACLTNILSFLPTENLRSARAVCQLWNEIISSPTLWRVKCERTHGIVIPITIDTHLWSYQSLYLKNPFGRNLVQNWCGEEKFKHWTILENGGHHWVTESEPHGANTLRIADTEYKSCWAPGYADCVKAQVVDLLEQGLTKKLLDTVQPELHFSEWTTPRKDCSSVYHCRVELISISGATMGSHEFERTEPQWNGGDWQEMDHTFAKYGKGLQKVKIIHGGRDQKFWAGHYGPKITATSLRLLTPIHH